MDELIEAQDALIPAHPFLHLAFLDVGNDVVDGFETDRLKRRRAISVRVELLESRSEHALVLVAVDEAVCRVAIGPNGGVLVNAEIVFLPNRGSHADCPLADHMLKGPL